jgi:hypothetical protein
VIAEPKSSRDNDAQNETAGAETHGRRLRPPDRRDRSQYCLDGSIWSFDHIHYGNSGIITSTMG